MPVDHYENFPVASWLLPPPARAPIEAIYAFARGADDIADEGEASAEERLAGLARYSRALDQIAAGSRPSEPPFARLADAVRDYDLPLPLLRDLLDAFAQDVTTKRYATYADLLDYSRRSANPIGRLVLHVMAKTHTGVRHFVPGGRTDFPPDGTKCQTPVLQLTPVEQSDAICSALQFINFWQDVAVDWAKGRVYIPQEDLERFGVSERDIAEQRADERWRRLMAFECERSRALLASGSPLGHALPGRLGLEIRATVHGGAAILDKIAAVDGDVFRHRPVLGKADWVRIIAAAAFRTETR